MKICLNCLQKLKNIMKASLLRSMVFMTMAKSGWQKLFQRWNLLKIVTIGIMFICVKNWLVCLGVNIMVKKIITMRLKKEYPDYVYEPIGPENYEECKAFGDEWCEKRVGEDESLRCEQCAIHEAIDNFEALGLRGGAIRVNGKIEAFSFGKKINDDTAVLHVEKANPDIRGIYAAINKEFAEHAWGDVVYLNREEDMGHEGLRTAKESYHPEFMIKKYSSVFK